MGDIKHYFLNLSSTEKFIWGCAAILLLKWVLGDSKVGGAAYTGQAAFTVYKGGVALWGVALYAIAVLGIRIGWIKAYISDKNALLVLYGLYSVWIAILAFSIELYGSQIQFVLSAGFVYLQLHVYRKLT